MTGFKFLLISCSLRAGDLWLVITAALLRVASVRPPERLDQVVNEEPDPGRHRLAGCEDRVKLDPGALVIRQNPHKPAGLQIVGDIPGCFQGYALS